MNILGAMSCRTDEGVSTSSTYIFNNGIRFEESVYTSGPFLGQACWSNVLLVSIQSNNVLSLTQFLFSSDLLLIWYHEYIAVVIQGLTMVRTFVLIFVTNNNPMVRSYRQCRLLLLNQRSCTSLLDQRCHIWWLDYLDLLFGVNSLDKHGNRCSKLPFCGTDNSARGRLFWRRFWGFWHTNGCWLTFFRVCEKVFGADLRFVKLYSRNSACIHFFFGIMQLLCCCAETLRNLQEGYRLCHGYINANLHPYPPIPTLKTHTGWHTLGEH